MEFTNKMKDYKNREKAGQFDKYPDTCPICRANTHSNPVYSTYDDSTEKVQLVFRCNNSNCRHIFLSNYSYLLNKQNIIECSFKSSEPLKYKKEKFADTIENISQSFSKIYNQSIQAETFGLDEVAGIGLRKSLEFLIKDYIIHNLESQKSDSDKDKIDKKIESVKKNTLSKCIKDNIDDTKIKKLAERATWLGNDEAHYMRRWEDKDIGHLKILINLTVSYIDKEILSDKLIAEMPE